MNESKSITGMRGVWEAVLGSRLVSFIMLVLSSYVLGMTFRDIRDDYVMRKKNNKRMVVVIINVITCLLALIIIGGLWVKNLPRTANAECVMESGIVEEYSLNEHEKYDLFLRYGTDYYELENVSSDTLHEEDYVKVAIPLINFYPNIVKEINGKTTERYRMYYGNPWIDKLWVGIYAFVNLVIQLWLLKKEGRRRTIGADGEWFGKMWLWGILFHSIVLLFSLFNIFDNYILGVVVVVSFLVYQSAALVYLFSTAKVELRNPNAQINKAGETEEMTEEQKNRAAKRNWIRLIVVFTVMAVIATVGTYFTAVESRRWIALVFYPASYVIGMAAIVYGMKHPKKNEDGKKEND